MDNYLIPIFVRHMKRFLGESKNNTLWKKDMLMYFLFFVVPLIWMFSSCHMWNITFATNLGDSMEESSSSYQKVQLPNTPLSSSVTDNNTLALSISGYVNLSNMRVELNSFIISKSSHFTNLSSDSPFRIKLLGENGEIIAEYPFVPILSTALLDTNSTRALISEVIPYINSTKKIVLLKDNLELGSRYISEHAPAIKIISPKGGEFINGSTTIKWLAQDQDGDNLTYFLSYSNDEGRTWQSIVSNLRNTTSLNIDTETLPGNTVSPSLFRIIATDGVNTAVDVSDAFTIPPRAHH